MSNNHPEIERRRDIADLVRWQGHVDSRLTAQDKMLRDIDSKIDGHVTFAKAEFTKVAPVVEAMETMQSGIKVIGWIGSKATAIATLITAVIASFVAWKGWK